jgi:hypothetical protein
MWGPLQNPKHVEFYEQLHADRLSYDEDWMPMAQAVQQLQSLAVAPRLYAFTSLWRFHVTTAPTFQEHERHCSISISWRWPEKRFHIAFGCLADGWVDDRPPEQICDEATFPMVIELFIERLLSSLSLDR